MNNYRFDNGLNWKATLKYDHSRGAMDDYLFYGLFFLDGIEIYGIESTKIDTIPGYSNKQHDGNIGEGQFHLNNNSIDFHRKKYIQMELNYDQLFELLQK